MSCFRDSFVYISCPLSFVNAGVLKHFTLRYAIRTDRFTSCVLLVATVLLCTHDEGIRRGGVRVDIEVSLLRPQSIALTSVERIGHMFFDALTCALKSSSCSVPIMPSVRILFWACVFKFERMSFTIFSVVAIICGGLFLASWGQTNFSLPGLLMILGASCFSGLRRVSTVDERGGVVSRESRIVPHVHRRVL